MILWEITCAGPRPRGCAGRASPWQPPRPCSAAAASPALLRPPAQGAHRESSCMQADAFTCQSQPSKASQTLAMCRTSAIAKPRSISHGSRRGDLVRWLVGAL